MSGRRHVVREVIVEAPPEAVFAALTDWPTQGEWMLGTRVWADGDGRGVGARISAFTGVGRIGFLLGVTPDGDGRGGGRRWA